MTSSAQRIPDSCDAVGTLKEITEREGCLIARFQWGEVIIPSELSEKLMELVGKRIGILHLDGQYRVKVLGGNSHGP